MRAAKVAAATRLGAPLLLVQAKGTLIHASTPDVNNALLTRLGECLHEEAARRRGLGATVEDTVANGAEEVLAQPGLLRRGRVREVDALPSGAAEDHTHVT